MNANAIQVTGIKTKRLSIETGINKYQYKLINGYDLGLDKNYWVLGMAIRPVIDAGNQFCKDGTLISPDVFENGRITLKDRLASSILDNYELIRIMQNAVFFEPRRVRDIDFSNSIIEFPQSGTAPAPSANEFIEITVLYTRDEDYETSLKMQHLRKYQLPNGDFLPPTRIASIDVNLVNGRREYKLSKENNLTIPENAIIVGVDFECYSENRNGKRPALNPNSVVSALFDGAFLSLKANDYIFLDTHPFAIPLSLSGYRPDTSISRTVISGLVIDRKKGYLPLTPIKRNSVNWDNSTINLYADAGDLDNKQDGFYLRLNFHYYLAK